MIKISADDEETIDYAAIKWQGTTVTVNHTVYVPLKNNHKIVKIDMGTKAKVLGIFLTRYNTIVAKIVFENHIETKVNVRCLLSA
jgi:hypothetical protein